MKPEIKAMWVEALRSGKYPQTQQTLKNSEGFCCLGVLCDLASEEKIGEWVYRSDGPGYFAFVCRSDTRSGTPPQDVMEWCDQFRFCQKVDLIELNDNGTPFSEIADLIEKHL